MKKYLILFTLLLLLLCASCTKKPVEPVAKTINLKEIYDKNEYEFAKKLKPIFYYYTPAAKFISKDTLSQSEYDKYVEEYIKRDFVSAILIYSNRRTIKFAVEYENKDIAIDEFNVSREDHFVYDKYVFFNCWLAYELFFDIYNNNGYNITSNNILTSSEHGENILPNDVYYIANYAFAGKNDITKVVCNSNLKVIGKNAFSECTNLKTIVLNDGLNKINSKAFYDVYFDYIIIPSSVSSISASAFNKGNIFVEIEEDEADYSNIFAVEDAKVYWKGEWELVNNIPTPIEGE